MLGDDEAILTLSASESAQIPSPSVRFSPVRTIGIMPNGTVFELQPIVFAASKQVSRDCLFKRQPRIAPNAAVHCLSIYRAQWVKPIGEGNRKIFSCCQ